MICFLLLLMLLLHSIEFPEPCIPVCLQCISNHPVIGIDLEIAASCQFSLVTRLFELCST